LASASPSRLILLWRGGPSSMVVVTRARTVSPFGPFRSGRPLEALSGDCSQFDLRLIPDDCQN
jgi:hypothetical protein